MLHYRSIIGADDQALKYVQSNQGYFYTMFLYQNIECDPLWHVVLDPEIEVKYPFIENLKQHLSIQKLFGFFFTRGAETIPEDTNAVSWADHTY